LDVHAESVAVVETDTGEVRGMSWSQILGKGVLVFGSDFLTHNMRCAFRPGVPEWPRERWPTACIAATRDVRIRKGLGSVG
jgi:hypothetical protein